jgi:hypothetical protein
VWPPTYRPQRLITRLISTIISNWLQLSHLIVYEKGALFILKAFLKKPRIQKIAILSF